MLRRLGYSHIHVSPPQKSNERVWRWWGRYQPIDFTKIEGPLGSEAEFRAMTATAAANGIQILADVVLNHTVDLNEAPPGLVRVEGNRVVEDNFPQFAPKDFHDRCNITGDDTAQRCWLSNNLLDLKTENRHVRQRRCHLALGAILHGRQAVELTAKVSPNSICRSTGPSGTGCSPDNPQPGQICTWPI